MRAGSGGESRADHYPDPWETLDGDGNFTIENFQAPKVRTEQKVVYRCRGGRNLYHPTKTYMGFRYVLVEADFDVDPADFQAVAIYSDMLTTGEFSCGVPEVNQLFRNALWSMKGNFIDVPTDCPTRGEVRLLRGLPGIHPHGHVSDGLLSGLREMDPGGRRPPRHRRDVVAQIASHEQPEAEQSRTAASAGATPLRLFPII